MPTSSKIQHHREERRKDLRQARRARKRGADAVARRNLHEAQHHLRVIRRERHAEAHGHVVVLPGANRPGVAIQPHTMDFFEAVSRELGDTITVSTGTNHNRLTTTGNVSDHWDGEAGDFGNSWNDRNAVARAALRTCGYSAATAAVLVKRGGIFNTSWHGHRVQVIVNTYAGGNHYTHCHLGCN